MFQHTPLLVSCCGSDGGGIWEVQEGRFKQRIHKNPTRGLLVRKGKLYFVEDIGGPNFLTGPRCERVLIEADFHGMQAVLGREKIGVMSTRKKEIRIYTPSWDLVKRIPAHGKHPNDFTYSPDGGLTYTCFGHVPDEGGCLVHRGKVIQDKLEQPHSPTYTSFGLLVCDSKNFRVLNVTTGQVSPWLRGYTRGLYWDENFLYVGISYYRKSDRTSDQVGVKVLDRQLKEVYFIPSPHEYMEIYTIVKDTRDG